MNKWIASLLIAFAAVAIRGTGSLAEAPAKGISSSGPLYVAAVQLKVDPAMYTSKEAFEARIEAALAEVATKVPQNAEVMVAFPEDVGIFLVLADAPKSVYEAPDLQQAITRLTKANFLQVGWTKLVRRVGWVRALALSKAIKMEAIYSGTFSKLAKKYGYWICAGSTGAPEFTSKGKIASSEVYNISYCYDNHGKRIAVQKKVHLVDIEAKDMLDLVPGKLNELDVFEVAGRKVGISICLDGFYPDVLDALGKKVDGSKLDILIQPSANAKPWNAWQQEDWLRSIYTAVAREGRASVGLNPMMVGSMLGLVYEGQSSIVVNPGVQKTTATEGYSLMGPMKGFASVAKSANNAEILIYRID